MPISGETQVRRVVFTADNYRQMPEDGKRYEVIDGELHMAPAPNRFHQDISRNLEFILLTYLKANPVGVLYDAPFDVYLSRIDVFQPDILYVSKERAAVLTDAGATGAPDLVIEILSPSTVAREKKKRRIYAREGVRELWQIDPVLKQVQDFQLAASVTKPAAYFEEDETFESGLFPGLAIKLSEVFAQPFPSRQESEN